MDDIKLLKEIHATVKDLAKDETHAQSKLIYVTLQLIIGKTMERMLTERIAANK
jgi:hypothetical protein